MYQDRRLQNCVQRGPRNNLRCRWKSSELSRLFVAFQSDCAINVLSSWCGSGRRGTWCATRRNTRLGRALDRVGLGRRTCHRIGHGSQAAHRHVRVLRRTDRGVVGAELLEAGFDSAGWRLAYDRVLEWRIVVIHFRSANSLHPRTGPSAGWNFNSTTAKGWIPHGAFHFKRESDEISCLPPTG